MSYYEKDQNIERIAIKGILQANISQKTKQNIIACNFWISIENQIFVLMP